MIEMGHVLWLVGGSLVSVEVQVVNTRGKGDLRELGVVYELCSI